MQRPTDPRSAAADRALAGERLRSARRLGFFRFVGISIAYASNWLIPHLVLESARYEADLRLFACYWLIAAGVFWAGRWSTWIARLVGLDIAVVDIRLAFLLQAGVVTRNLGNPGPALFGVGYNVLLVLAAAFSLESWRIVFAAAIAAAFQVLLLSRAGLDAGTMTSAVSIIAGVAAISVFNTMRTIHLVRSVAEGERRRQRLGRYFSPEVAAQLEKRGDGAAAGESREVTILFSDLRDFTALSATLTSEEVVAMLNEYHARMVETVFAHGGTLDMYLGDGLMAYFGARWCSPTTPNAPCAARLPCRKRSSLSTLSAPREERRRSALGIGLHTGRVVVGDVGSPQRQEYTAIGDAVNTAARIEELTKVHGTPILVSEETCRQVGGAIRFAAVGPTYVKGKSEPVAAYVPMPDGFSSAEPHERR